MNGPAQHSGGVTGMKWWRRRSARIGGAALGVACVFLIGCAKTREATAPLVPVPALVTPPQGDAEPFEWALTASGRSVVGVDAKLLSEMRGREIRLENGSVLAVRPYLVRVRQGAAEGNVDPTSVAARIGWWLGLSVGGRVQAWSAVATSPPVSETDLRDGAPVLVVETSGAPGVAGMETWGEVGGRRVKVRWLGGPTIDAKTAGVFARPINEEAWESVWMRAALQGAERSPLTRWRARLARGELLGGPADTSPKKELSAFSDPVIEDLARTIEAQWASVLANLAARDPIVARRVVERLCATVDFGGGVIVPAWVSAGEELTSLFDSLMGAGPSGATEAAAAWLEHTKAVLCWVVDDAGSADSATGQPMGMVGVANLTEAPMATWADASGGGGIPEILAASPWSVRRVPATVGEAVSDDAKRPAGLAAGAALRGSRVSVHAGERVFGPTLYGVRVPALAPGVVIGPLHPDWRMADWLVAGVDDAYTKRLGPWSDSTLSDPGWSATGMVYRGVDAPLEQGASMPDRWLLFMELKEPSVKGRGGGEGGAELLRVWFGPFGRSRIVLKVLKDGRVIDESPPVPEAGGTRDLPRMIRVARTEQGWACWLPIPLSAIDRDGTLRLGVERVDPRGVRTSWPRPSLPWQQEPSRIAIDTLEWGDRK